MNCWVPGLHVVNGVRGLAQAARLDLAFKLSSHAEDLDIQGDGLASPERSSRTAGFSRLDLGFEPLQSWSGLVGQTLSFCNNLGCSAPKARPRLAS